MKETAKKMAEIAQTQQHVHGIAVPRRWYYMLDFYYTGPFSGPNPTKEASIALAKAEEKVVKKAKAAKLDIRGAYAWPDGSLYFYLRTRKPVACWPEELHKIFDEGDLQLGSVREETDFQTLGSGIDVLTVEEKFARLPREEHNALIKRRCEEREAFYDEYRKARKECSDCTSPGLGCKGCMDLCKAAEKAQDEWRTQLRPTGRDTISDRLMPNPDCYYDCYYCHKPIERLSDGYMVDGLQPAFIHKSCHHKKIRRFDPRILVMIVVVAGIVALLYALGVPGK